MFVRLLLLFTVVPLIELALLVYLGQWVGFWPTMALVLGTGVLGAWLAKVQGLFVLRQVQSELAQGRMPTNALVDGALILVAGTVLLTPGLITDLFGFVLLVPPGRAAARRWAMGALGKRLRSQPTRIIDVQ
jgi:UPF0716 protein FxsA